MSWISENYEKASIGAATVAAIGLGYLGWQKMNAIESDFSGTATGATTAQSDPSIPSADLVSTAKSSFQLDREWTKTQDSGRPIDLFTGVPLFLDARNPKSPINLADPKVEPVHPPIPNQWWLDHRVDPGFNDSPLRDADADGFSNLDEFLAKSDPSDKRDYPGLITKLAYVGDEFIQWVLRPGFPGTNGEFTFEYNDSARRAAKISAASPIQPGNLLFPDGPLKDRFKFIGSEKRTELNEKLNVQVDVTIVTVEDQKPNKLGTKYEVPAQFRRGDAGKFAQYDRTAILTLEAVGLEGKEMKIEEFTPFALPPDAKEKSYKIIKITPEAITVEHTKSNGTTQLYTLSKGAVGPKAP